MQYLEKHYLLFLFFPAVLSLLVIVYLSACTSFGSYASGKRLLRMQQSPHYKDDKFQNPVPTSILMPGTTWRMLKTDLFGQQIRRPPTPVPVYSPEQAKARLSRPPGSGLRLTWLCHACVLIEIDNYRILTDPIFSRRASPLSWAGPKSYLSSPLGVEDIPKLHAVVISHDHYDHLDQGSIVALNKAGVDLFVTPLGMGAHLEKWGVSPDHIVELDWWEKFSLNQQIEFVSLPSRHFSGRRLFDRYSTQWASWAFVGPKHRVYFSGDTGMFPGLSDIGQRFGPFDATLMNIGAYSFAWPAVHMTPEEAMTAHRMLRGKALLPTHWGTFDLASHDWNEPMERLLKTGHEKGTSCELHILTPHPGQPVEIGDSYPMMQQWWRMSEKNGRSSKKEKNA